MSKATFIASIPDDPVTGHWAGLEGPMTFVSAYTNSWNAAKGWGDSLTASTTDNSITINVSGQYYCEAFQRSLGTDTYIGIGLSGDRTALETRTTGQWGHDHSTTSGVWTKGIYIGYLEAGEKITMGPPAATHAANLSYAAAGFTGGLIIRRLA